jgi:hypothetical protein
MAGTILEHENRLKLAQGVDSKILHGTFLVAFTGFATS